MPIRLVEEKDYLQLASLYSAFFKVHTIFQREQDIVVAYLRKEAIEREILIYEEGNLIKGALILVKAGTNRDGSHQRWKFRHIAFESERIGQELIREAETRIIHEATTAKVELTIAESEEGISFYEKQGYKKEGVLMHHYRWGEKCFVFGKSLPIE